jgi:hypothetical protein
MLFLPTVIASVLLLSAASPQSRATPGPRPTAGSRDDAPNASNASSPIKTKLAEASPTPIPVVPSAFENKSSSTTEKNDYEKRQYRLNVLQTWFNGGLAIFTLFLVVIGVYQGYQLRRTVLATKQSADAAKESADAAKVSADAAKITVQAGRPYLLVEKGELKGFDLPNEITEAILTFKNFGKRPALISRIVLRLNHVEVGKYPAKGDFSECVEKSSAVYAVGIDDTFQITTDAKDGWVAPLNMEDIREGKRALICYGCLYYTDTIGNDSYETSFFWYYLPHPPAFLKLSEMAGQPRRYKGRFLPAKAFNYHT